MVPSRTIDHGNVLLSILKSKSKPRFTEKQGQYLAFIHTYLLLHFSIAGPQPKPTCRPTSESRPPPSIEWWSSSSGSV